MIIIIIFFKTDSAIEPRTEYVCTDGIRIKSRKDRQQRRCKDFVNKVQKKSELSISIIL